MSVSGTEVVRFAAMIPSPPAGLRLGDLPAVGRAWAATESGWRTVPRQPGDRVHGFAMAYVDGIAALYSARGRLWLQCGARGWDRAGLRSVRQTDERSASSSTQTVGERSARLAELWANGASCGGR